MKNNLTKKATAILMTTAMTISVSSMTVLADTKDVKDGGLTFGITYWTESDFFKTIAGAIQESAEADGNSVTVVNGEQDSAKQIQIIEDFITKGVDAVFLNPVDRDAIAPALELLNEAGIPIINFDSSVANLDLVDAYVATDNVQAGVLCAEAMIKDFPDGGEIAVLNYPANSACLDREQGFLDTIEGKGFEVVATFDAEGTVEKGQDITSDILQAHPDLTAIFSINDQAGMGAYAACTIADAEVAIYGVDGNPEAKSVIAQDGIYKMSAAQSPIQMGKTCYDVAAQLLAGEELEEKTIDVPVFAIDLTNVNDYLEGWQ
ncbi:MAG: substrate-binding domain-containing protein [Blautia sp.]|nr:substrate-binding domain-containing protein [Blautia sp.]